MTEHDLAKQAATRLGDALHRARIERRLSQEDVGDATGVSASWVSRVENGHGGAAPIATWFAMAAAVGLDLSVAMAPIDGTAGRVDRFRRRAVDHLADIAEAAGGSVRSEIVIDAQRGVLTTVFGRRTFARTGRQELAIIRIWDVVDDVSSALGRFDDLVTSQRDEAVGAVNVSGAIVVRRTTDARYRLRSQSAALGGRFQDTGASWISTLRRPGFPMPQEASIIWIDATATRLIPMFLALERPRRSRGA